MNNTLQLKGRFGHGKAQHPGPPSLPVNAVVTTDQIRDRINDLRQVITYWNAQPRFIDPLVEVHYRTVVAKSNRIKRLLSSRDKSANDAIVGATFGKNHDGKTCHVITHYVKMETIESTLRNLEATKEILAHHGNTINNKGLASITQDGLAEIDARMGLSKTSFAQIIRDVYYVERFTVKTYIDSQQEHALVAIYDTGRNGSQTVALLNKLGVDVIGANLLDTTTINMAPDQYRKLTETAPYLIAMSLKDTLELKFEPDSNQIEDQFAPSIPMPTNEPIVGVIDTCFDAGKTYFSEWVEYHDELDPQIGIAPEDYTHGTEVTSLIVDGPTLNPALDDGCGRFRVRHFAVAKSGNNSSFTIVKTIRNIVISNPDIKVWNLSLGSRLESPENTISPEAAMLDKLQNEYDIVFVVAGTNKTSRDSQTKPKRIGAPADSINSLVVNATSILKEPASYTREGPVLNFFRKPDISCFGGDNTEQMAVWSPRGVTLAAGTSFAAPWITRKMAYLIYVMHFSREIAKAMLIDAASGWEQISADNIKLGYGIVPIRIEDILATPSNEIRFVLEGVVTSFETYNYRIPVPMANGKYPYMARATLCYFPKCNAKQGVDYTSTELDFHFGRMKEKDIDSLNNNIQGDPTAYTYESDARKLYRKWDNVKHVSDIEKSRFQPRISHGIPYWGLKIRKTERFDPPIDKNGNVGRNAGDGLHFGIVVTLWGMDGRNRFEEFKRHCQLQAEPWIVEEIDMHSNIELYQESDVEIDFDENNDA